MMTRWNFPSGEAAHAEPVGRAWLEMGHELVVFAPRGIDLIMLQRDDEDFVQRCYILDLWGQREHSNFVFDPRPFLEEDYDIFVVETAQFMPMPELLKIFHQIRKKAKTVLVVHETGLPEEQEWYEFGWDAIVCFDQRFRDFIVKAFPRTRIEIINFPCYAPLPGSMKKARISLGLPEDKKIALAYGFNIANTHADLFPVMEQLSRCYPILFLVISHHNVQLNPHSKPELVRLIDEMPDLRRLYTYLHASDTYVYYVRKGNIKTEGIGVSSSVPMCLGAGRPILVTTNCNFFDLSGNEVIKYSSFQELEHRLRDVFNGAEYIRQALVAADEYAVRNSPDKTATRFIQLFSELLA